MPDQYLRIDNSLNSVFLKIRNTLLYYIKNIIKLKY